MTTSADTSTDPDTSTEKRLAAIGTAVFAIGPATMAGVVPWLLTRWGGLYRLVRNPMYLAIAAAVTGQALLLGQRKLFAASAVGAIPVTAFVRFYEEPTLKKKFGAEYEAYSTNVPRWLPRLTPWRQVSSSG